MLPQLKKSIALICLIGVNLYTPLALANQHVTLDIGHSPGRSGAISPTGNKEYDYNINLTQIIYAKLQANDIKVSYSLPESNLEAKLTARTANTHNSDLFVSIHHDSMPQEWIDQGLNETLSGYSVFISKLNKFPVESYNCAQHIGYELGNGFESPSLYHAIEYKGKSKPLLNKDFGVHQFDNLVVLKTAQTPAVLVEAGVITNPHEDIRLKNPEVVEKLADSITKGIISCLKK